MKESKVWRVCVKLGSKGIPALSNHQHFRVVADDVAGATKMAEDHCAKYTHYDLVIFREMIAELTGVIV